MRSVHVRPAGKMRMMNVMEREKGYNINKSSILAKYERRRNDQENRRDRTLVVHVPGCCYLFPYG